MAAGILFDVDGTLVDTTYLHTVTWWEALQQYDLEAPMATIHRAIGMGSDKILDEMLGPDRNREHDDEVRAAHTALYATYRTRLRPLPGAADLLRECAARGWTIGLASSASPQDFAALMRALDADDVIAGATNKGDADRSKPDPDLLEAALDRIGLPADRVVYVGDAVWDVKAAERLGIPCLALTCGGISAAELRESGALAVYADPADLHANLDDLPDRAAKILSER